MISSQIFIICIHSLQGGTFKMIVKGRANVHTLLNSHIAEQVFIGFTVASKWYCDQFYISNKAVRIW